MMNAEKIYKILDILKPRIQLKESTLKNIYFTLNENSLPELEKDLKEREVVFIEASGFVFKDSDEYKLLKEWISNK